MTKEEIIRYIMQSPENTNPAVLEGMLDEFGSGGSGSGDLSIASVGVNFIDSPRATIQGPLIVSDEDDDDKFGIIYGSISDDGIYKIPIYGVGALFELYSSDDVTVEIEGDISFFDAQFLIFGDGSITITLDENDIPPVDDDGK